mmetsp:Transcript_58214/g.87763  ORF Transcript_58214/g.87763 Transcript_58214/m.87763 type:complete len:226 (+) Transcript_58214:126-803(+)
MNYLQQDLSGANLPGIADSCPLAKVNISQEHDWGASACDKSFEKREAGSPLKNGAKLDLRDDCTQRGAKMDFLHAMTSDSGGGQNVIRTKRSRTFIADATSTFLDTSGVPTPNVSSDGSIHGDAVYDILPIDLGMFGEVSVASPKRLHRGLPQNSRHIERDEPQSPQSLFIRHRKKGKAKRAGKQILLPTSFGVRSLPREIELRKDMDDTSHAREFTLSMHESFP